MSKSLYFIVNIMIYWVIVTGTTGLSTGSFGKVLALLLGGAFFAAMALIVEPVLAFFKFPGNFWGFLVVGFILNLLVFSIFTTGILPAILIVKAGALGDGFTPLPFPVIRLGSPLLLAIAVSLMATLSQILVRKLANS